MIGLILGTIGVYIMYQAMYILSFNNLSGVSYLVLGTIITIIGLILFFKQ